MAPRSNSKTSLVQELISAPVSGVLAFALIALASTTVLGATWQMDPEIKIGTAVADTVAIASHASNTTRVLGTSKTVAGSVAAMLLVNGEHSSTTVASGTAVQLSWTSRGADDCVLDPLEITGTQGSGLTIPLKKTTTFTLTCKGNTGTQTDKVTVNIGNVVK